VVDLVRLLEGEDEVRLVAAVSGLCCCEREVGECASVGLRVWSRGFQHPSHREEDPDVDRTHICCRFVCLLVSSRSALQDIHKSASDNGAKHVW